MPALSRRDFLKLAGASFTAANLRPLGRPLPPEPAGCAPLTGRVTSSRVYAYLQPDFDSPRLRRLTRDDLFPMFDEVISPAGPAHNPRWYRLAGGYVHSGRIQRVDASALNTPLLTVPEAGLLAEVTVPYTQTLYQTTKGEWRPLYRLYYSSVHWITGVVPTAGREETGPWYRLTDEWLRVHYYAPAAALRPVPPAELAPLSPEIPAEEKRIEVSITDQTLTAYEGSQVVLHTQVSTGVRYMDTPAGEFSVNRKHPSKHMGNGGLTSSITAYELVGVPWTTFFTDTGIAFHGTFWHDNFGEKMSHGCVNMRCDEARWLFCWTAPSFDPAVTTRAGWKVSGTGTGVSILSA